MDKCRDLVVLDTVIVELWGYHRMIVDEVTGY